MKRIVFLIASLLLISHTATASENNTLFNGWNTGYGNSYIFMEGGIEFSVFPDGQFDFYASHFGPRLNIGLNTQNLRFSFNTGFNYNAFVQYDTFGAVIQIENTPIFYDYYGRVSQIGNILIQYNNFGQVARIGGLQILYRNNIAWNWNGFINSYNRFYVFRPWHRFYRVPARNYCVVYPRPYRQYYTPIRHTFYRPYRNNHRYATINGRRNYTRVNRDLNSNHFRRYAQTPRNSKEREIQKRFKSNRYATNHRTRGNSISRENARLERTKNTSAVRGLKIDKNASRRNIGTKQNRANSLSRADNNKRTNANYALNQTNSKRTVKPKSFSSRTYNRAMLSKSKENGLKSKRSERTARNTRIVKQEKRSERSTSRTPRRAQ